MTYVYGLYEGFSNHPFYIGITKTPKKRLWCHKAALDGRRQDSLTGVKVKSRDVTMRLYAECDDRANAHTIEKALQVFHNVTVVNSTRLIK